MRERITREFGRLYGTLLPIVDPSRDVTEGRASTCMTCIYRNPPKSPWVDNLFGPMLLDGQNRRALPQWSLNAYIHQLDTLSIDWDNVTGWFRMSMEQKAQSAHAGGFYLQTKLKEHGAPLPRLNMARAVF